MDKYLARKCYDDKGLKDRSTKLYFLYYIIFTFIYVCIYVCI